MERRWAADEFYRKAEGPMKELIDGLSLGDAAGIIAVVSACLAVVWARLTWGYVKWCLVLATPVILSWALYWTPVWLGADPLEFGTFEFLFIVPWSIAGVVSSVAAMFVTDLFLEFKREPL